MNVFSTGRQRWTRLSIATKLAVWTLLMLTTVLGALTWLASGKVRSALDERSLAQLTVQTDMVITMMETYDKNLRETAGRLGGLFASSFNGEFSVDNAKTLKFGDVQVPVMKNGDTALNLNFDAVEKFTTASGAVATIFVRIGDDFFRVSTTLKKENGDRAIGTFLGKQHPAYAAMMKGENWIGKAKLFGRDYMNQYRPVKNADGRVIGLLFIGLDFTQGLNALTSAIKKIKIGETGYVVALDVAPGANQGVLTIHPTDEGKNPFKAVASGTIFQQLVANPDGTYRNLEGAASGGTGDAHEKIVVSREFKPWRWAVAAGTWSEEFTREGIALRNYLAAGTLAAGLLLASLLYYGLRRNVSRPLREVMVNFDAIGAGRYDNVIASGRGGEIGALLSSLDRMQTKLSTNVGEMRRIAGESLRVKVGLDNVETSVMIADPDGKVIYFNKALDTMFRNAAVEIRKALPAFDPAALAGCPFDTFHKAPVTGSATSRATLKLGACTFDLTITPVIDDKGERLGTAIEWVDRTEELAVEHEVSAIVQAASAGDFSKRIDLAGKTGFFRQLGDGINRLMETSHTGLNAVVEVLAAMAQGDLTHRIENDYQGTFGQLKDDSNQTVIRLTDIISRIRSATDSIHTASSEIAAGNADLSKRTEQQAASLQETASSMEELTTTVKQNADSAQQANGLAAGASTVAVKGGQVVSEVVRTMDSITASSKKIVDIISVIDGIAFQTNILALNAAVEAARAGEQGRGFAVVATEVRNLAQRSASAAKEIKGLIGDSVDKVQTGSKLVHTAGETMEEIVRAVKRVTDIMGEITTASREQSDGIEQVTVAITQMDQATQQNASLVEQSAAAADQMKRQATALSEAVSVFVVAKSTKLTSKY
jgi:methyl-accepting chemotaxis protein